MAVSLGDSWYFPVRCQNILSLKKEFEKKSYVLSNADMLAALFPDQVERELEVIVRTREILTNIIEVNTPKAFCDLCLTQAPCKFRNPRRVFYELGLDFDEEAFYSDPTVIMLKECRAYLGLAHLAQQKTYSFPFIIVL